MSNAFTATGNLADAPELKEVTVDGERRHVTEMRLYCDRPVPDGANGFKDKGGFWLNVSLWDKRGEHAARVLAKGLRIKVEGTLVQNAWQKDGEDRSRLELTAQNVTLDLSRIESITLREKNGSSAAGQNDTADNAEDAAYG